MKPHIIFYKKRASVAALEGTYLHNKLLATDFGKTLKDFARGKIPVLFVHATLVTGWRTQLYENQVHIIFLGTGWTKPQIAQAKARPQCRLGSTYETAHHLLQKTL